MSPLKGVWATCQVITAQELCLQRQHGTPASTSCNWEIRGDLTPSSWVFSPEKPKLLCLAFASLRQRQNMNL